MLLFLIFLWKPLEAAPNHPVIRSEDVIWDPVVSYRRARKFSFSRLDENVSLETRTKLVCPVWLDSRSQERISGGNIIEAKENSCCNKKKNKWIVQCLVRWRRKVYGYIFCSFSLSRSPLTHTHTLSHSLLFMPTCIFMFILTPTILSPFFCTTFFYKHPLTRINTFEHPYLCPHAHTHTHTYVFLSSGCLFFPQDQNSNILVIINTWSISNVFSLFFSILKVLFTSGQSFQSSWAAVAA